MPHQFSTMLAEQFPSLHVADVGVYKGMSNKDYHRSAALSRSWGQVLLHSPNKLKYQIENPKEPTRPLVLGNAIHAAVLEPDSFRDKYIALPAPDPDKYRDKKGNIAKSPASTAAYKNACAEIMNASPDAVVLSDVEFAQCMSIRDAVYSNTYAKGHLLSKGHRELSLFWDVTNEFGDPLGILGRAKPDHVALELMGGTVLDLKSTTDAREAKFERDILNYGYHEQAAWYLNGLRALDIPVEQYTILAVEKEPPHDLGLYIVDHGAIDAGWQRIEKAALRFKKCVESADWPGLPASQKVMPISIPHYGFTQIEEEKMREA